MPAQNARFQESQAFPTALIVFMVVVDVVVLGLQLRVGVTPGVLGLTLALMLPLLVLMTMLRLRTTVTGGELRISLIVRRTIALADIASAQVRTYSPIMEYGGWGIRWGRGGRAYNARGNRGVQLVLRSGERVLVGSQRPEELLEALQDVPRG